MVPTCSYGPCYLMLCSADRAFVLLGFVGNCALIKFDRFRSIIEFLVAEPEAPPKHPSCLN